MPFLFGKNKKENKGNIFKKFLVTFCLVAVFFSSHFVHLDAADTVPVITSFTIPATSSSLTIPISSFTATDDSSVAGYKLTETPTPPAAGDAGWTATAPTSYTFASANGVAPTSWSTVASSQNWYGLASSADGTKLAGVAYGGKIYTSTNSGANWTARDSNRNWYAITSSADGTKLAAAVLNGVIYTSSNSGETWTPRNSGTKAWHWMASSADGTKIFATAGSDYLYKSEDSGVTWVPMINSGIRNWWNIASSADGTKLVAVVYSNGYIYSDIPPSIASPPPRWIFCF